LLLATASTRRTGDALGELIPFIQDAIHSHPAIVAYQAVLAMGLARTGQRGAAQAILDRLIANDVTAIPRHVQWYSAMTSLADAADLVDDRAAAQLLAKHLEPYAGRLAVHDAGVSTPIDLALAQLALTYGDYERGAALARKAADAGRRNTTPIFLGRALVGLAAARRRMGEQPSGHRSILDEAEAIAQRTGAALITRESIRYGLARS
jgi:hypothetical protein